LQKFLQGRALAQPLTKHDCIELVPLYSGRLDGAYLQGADNLESMWAEPGVQLAVALRAQHPYMEWQQQRMWTPLWRQEPIGFAALRKTKVSIATIATWNRQALPDVSLLLDIRDVPRPPPPQPVPWEWCEEPTSYAHRVLVCSPELMSGSLRWASLLCEQAACIAMATPGWLTGKHFELHVHTQRPTRTAGRKCISCRSS
jgi:hypothetical protein